MTKAWESIYDLGVKAGSFGPVCESLQSVVQLVLWATCHLGNSLHLLASLHPNLEAAKGFALPSDLPCSKGLDLQPSPQSSFHSCSGFHTSPLSPASVSLSVIEAGFPCAVAECRNPSASGGPCAVPKLHWLCDQQTREGEASSFFKQNGIRCVIWFKKIYFWQ